MVKNQCLLARPLVPSNGWLIIRRIQPTGLIRSRRSHQVSLSYLLSFLAQPAQQAQHHHTNTLSPASWTPLHPSATSIPPSPLHPSPPHSSLCSSEKPPLLLSARRLSQTISHTLHLSLPATLRPAQPL